MIFPILVGAAMIFAAYHGGKAARKASFTPLPPSPTPHTPQPAPARPVSSETVRERAQAIAKPVAKTAARALSKSAQVLKDIADRATVGNASIPECVAGLAWHAKRPGFSGSRSPFYKGLSKQVGEVKADQILSRIRARGLKG